MAILVVGSVALDTIQTSRQTRKDVLGGSATYFSLAAGLFHPVRIVAVIGQDMPEYKIVCLKKKNIDLKGLEVKSGKTFRWWGRYETDLNMRRTLRLSLNVFQDFQPRIPLSYMDSEYLFLANIGPQLQKNVLKQMRSRCLVAADTIDHWIKENPDTLLRLLKKCDVFFVNDTEARLLSQYSNLYLAARWLREKGPSVIVIKKGEHGVLMLEGTEFFSAPAYPLEEVVDPTGAGDAFAGGFLGYLAYSRKFDVASLRRAAIYGSALGSFAVEAFGPARLTALNRRRVEERVKRFRRLIHF
jgi:sugar/nucleoside kinase (ribokinase family)